MAEWTGCVREAVYFYLDGHIEEDVIVPTRLLGQARILINQLAEPRRSEKSLVVTQ